jgi:hypothetical protein
MRSQSVNDQPPITSTPAQSAAPSLTARLLALVAIVVAGACGGLVGYSVTDLQCTDGCTAWAGAFGVFGAVLAAGGVGIVSVLTLRAMTEWRTGQRQQSLRQRRSNN